MLNTVPCTSNQTIDGLCACLGLAGHAVLGEGRVNAPEEGVGTQALGILRAHQPHITHTHQVLVLALPHNHSLISVAEPGYFGRSRLEDLAPAPGPAPSPA